MSNIETEKNLINDFVQNEYDSEEGADFSDLSNVAVAYTTTEDGQHEIQAYIDLIHKSIVIELDGFEISVDKFYSPAEFVDALRNLTFDELTYISDEQLTAFCKNTKGV